jgi:parvulin-like peptidyl-prolyl isomerase
MVGQMQKVLTWAACCLLLAACKTGVPEAELVAKVNEEGITKKDFQEQVDRNLARFRGQAPQMPPGIEARIQESVLRRMVDDAVIAQKAKTLQIDINDQELDAKFKEHKDRFASEQAFADYLKRSNNTEVNLKADLRRALLRDAVVEKLSGTVAVSDADVDKYYKDNEARFHEPEQIKTRRLIVKVAQDATPADKKAKLKQAEKYLVQARKAKTDFGKLAREHSDGPEASRDGDMGGFYARGHMAPEFDKVAFALQPNQFSEPVETRLGYEIVQLLEKKSERVKPLSDVKDGLQASLLARARNDRRRDVLRELKDGAKVEILVQFDQNAPPAGGAAPAGTPPGGAPAPQPVNVPPPAGGGVPPPAAAPGGGGPPPGLPPGHPPIAPPK